MLYLCAWMITGLACRKSNYSPYVPPPLTDSLLGWKVISTFPNKVPGRYMVHFFSKWISFGRSIVSDQGWW